MADKSKENPIDKDKVTEEPGTLPYAHHAGSAIVKPEDRGKIVGQALDAMHQQTDQQMQQLKEQMQLIADQAKKLQDRVDISEYIYNATINFQPLIGKVYHLYQKEDSSYVLSLIGPNEWGRSKPIGSFKATVRMMADHTWDVLETNQEEE